MPGVRWARRGDALELTRLVEMMVSESPYASKLTFDRKKTTYVWDEILKRLEDPSNSSVFLKVIDDGGTLSGLFFAERTSSLWLVEDQIAEQGVYVVPEARGSFAAGKLLMAFMKWAKLFKGSIRLEASSGIDAGAEAAFKKMKLHPRGTLWGLEVI
jgi:hypothetical protein